MTQAPKIPAAEQSFPGEKPDVSSDAPDRRDRRTNVHDGQPGDADVNTDQQGRFANIKQNTTARTR
ncbi:MAG: hypothetical protein KKG14_13705 [Alphaproteobacteria bacterium]|nr:hypothetical protein [Alphaproteobacteria bacterium]MBU2269738.1 hypothetical protein [Alphaproteobacteria bacterium]MBU2419751.1 hypothetical protein [Alphaproteobacteria bacterium]